MLARLIAIIAALALAASAQQPPPPTAAAPPSPPPVPAPSHQEPPTAILVALRAFPPEHRAEALAVAWCESRWDASAVGAAGEIGAWQVNPRWHGPVPADLAGQARQAAAIHAAHGWAPWSCAPQP